jgi:hypothetical protein
MLHAKVMKQQIQIVSPGLTRLGLEPTKLEPTKLATSMLTITQLMWSIHVLMKLCIYFYSEFPEKVLSILQFINEVNYIYIFTVDFQRRF